MSHNLYKSLKYFVVFILLFSSAITSAAQTSQDSSLYDQYYKSYRDAFYSGQMDSAFHYLRQQVKICSEAGMHESLMKVYGNFGYCFYFVPQPDSVEFYINKSNALIDELGDGSKKCLKIKTHNLSILAGNYRNNTGEVDKALDCYQQQFEISKNNDFPGILLAATSGICNIYDEQNESEKVLEYANIGLNAVEISVDSISWMGLKSYIGVTYGKLKDEPEKRKEGLQILMEQLEFTKTMKDGAYNEMLALADIINYYCDDIGTTKCFEYSERCYQIAQKSEVGISELVADIDYANALYRKGSYKQSLKIIDEGINLAQEFESSEYESNLYEVQHKVYDKLGDHKKAYIAYNQFKTLQDSTQAAVYEKSLLEAQAKFETKQKDEKIEKLNLQNEIISTRNKLLSLLGLVLFLAALSIFYFYRKSKQTALSLEKANRVKDQFFSIIAHDLRAPMTSFQNITQKVNFLNRKGRQEDVKALLSTVDKNADKLNNLLNNLLNWALVEQGVFPYEPENVNLQETVSEITHLFEETAQIKNIKIQQDISKNFNLYADKNAVSSILRNLINNAIKFSEEGDIITIKAVENNSQIQINVIDTGLGISAQKLSTIFDLKTKKSALGTLGEKGSGLGLVLCKELVEMNKGNIKIESEEGKGAMIQVALPRIA